MLSVEVILTLAITLIGKRSAIPPTVSSTKMMTPGASTHVVAKYAAPPSAAIAGGATGQSRPAGPALQPVVASCRQRNRVAQHSASSTFQTIMSPSPRATSTSESALGPFRGSTHGPCAVGESTTS